MEKSNNLGQENDYVVKIMTTSSISSSVTQKKHTQKQRKIWDQTWTALLL